MKKSLCFLLLVLFGFSGIAQNVWTNEFHYDNAGTDEGEFIEIVLENAGSYSLADFGVTLYNGNSGESYDTRTVDEFTLGIVSGDFSIYYFDYPANGIQNGENDGIAISYQGTLIEGQFISYEGTLTAVDGPAAGETSVDIGVSEIGTDPGYSLQLSGEGAQYDEFTWEEAAPETKGDLNNNQAFGTFVPDPEPSNYPTAFTATADGLSIALSWTDATGDQLPAAYLVYGESSTIGRAFEDPVDGVPVPDDLDWSDGMVAVNIPYGQESFSFEGLTGGMLYSFIIYPYTNSGSYIDYKTDGETPEAEATVESIVTISFEDFEDGTLGIWTEYSVTGEQKWYADEYNGDKFAKMSGYDGSPLENEDWLISPDLWQSNTFNVKFSFISAYFYDGPALELFVSNDYNGSGNPNDFTWTNLTDQAEWSGGNWNWLASGEIDIEEYYDGPCYLAFKYQSTSEESSTWELDNLFVYGSDATGLNEKETKNLLVYPNPADQYVQLTAEDNGKVTLVNLAGQVVMQKEVVTGVNTLSLSELSPGMYYVQLIDVKQVKSVSKLIVK